MRPGRFSVSRCLGRPRGCQPAGCRPRRPESTAGSPPSRTGPVRSLRLRETGTELLDAGRSPLAGHRPARPVAALHLRGAYRGRSVGRPFGAALRLWRRAGTRPERGVSPALCLCGAQRPPDDSPNGGRGLLVIAWLEGAVPRARSWVRREGGQGRMSRQCRRALPGPREGLSPPPLQLWTDLVDDLFRPDADHGLSKESS